MSNMNSKNRTRADLSKRPSNAGGQPSTGKPRAPGRPSIGSSILEEDPISEADSDPRDSVLGRRSSKSSIPSRRPSDNDIASRAKRARSNDASAIPIASAKPDKSASKGGLGQNPASKKFLPILGADRPIFATSKRGKNELDSLVENTILRELMEKQLGDTMIARKDIKKTQKSAVAGSAKTDGKSTRIAERTARLNELLDNIKGISTEVTAKAQKLSVSGSFPDGEGTDDAIAAVQDAQRVVLAELGSTIGEDLKAKRAACSLLEESVQDLKQKERSAEIENHVFIGRLNALIVPVQGVQVAQSTQDAELQSRKISLETELRQVVDKYIALDSSSVGLMKSMSLAETGLKNLGSKLQQKEEALTMREQEAKEAEEDFGKLEIQAQETIDDLSLEMACMTVEIDTHKKATSESERVAQDLLHNVKWDLRASEGDCVALETKIEEVTEELVKSHEKCTKVQKGLTKAESDLKDRTEQIKGLQQDVDRLRQEAEKFNGQMSLRHEELRSLRNDLDTANSDISQLCQGVEDLRRDLESARSETAVRESKLEGMKSDIALAKSDLTDRTEDVHRLREGFEASRKDIVGLQTTQGKAKFDVTQLTSDFQKLLGNSASQSGQLKSLRADHNKTQSTVLSQADQLRAAEVDKAALEEQLKELQVQHASILKAKGETETSYQALQSERERDGIQTHSDIRGALALPGYDCRNALVRLGLDGLRLTVKEGTYSPTVLWTSTVVFGRVPAGFQSGVDTLRAVLSSMYSLESSSIDVLQIVNIWYTWEAGFENEAVDRQELISLLCQFGKRIVAAAHRLSGLVVWVSCQMICSMMRQIDQDSCIQLTQEPEWEDAKPEKFAAVWWDQVQQCAQDPGSTPYNRLLELITVEPIAVNIHSFECITNMESMRICAVLFEVDILMLIRRADESCFLWIMDRGKVHWHLCRMRLWLKVQGYTADGAWEINSSSSALTRRWLENLGIEIKTRPP